MNGQSLDRYIRIAGRLFAIGLWAFSIYFSATGFGFKSGTLFVIAGYFLGMFVTYLEIVINRMGSSISRILIFICMLAYAYGCLTNVLGLWVGRGSEQTSTAWTIAIVLGILLEVVPEPLFMLSFGIKSNDLIDTLATLMGRSRQGQQAIPPYTSVRQHPIAHQRAQKHNQYQPPNQP